MFAVIVYFANLWPGWALSSATLATFLFGGNATVIAIAILLIIGVALTLAPVVYVALERLIFVKVALVFALIVLAVAFASAATRGARSRPDCCRWHRAKPARVCAAAGRSRLRRRWRRQNLCQSNWIRDKGFGMGKYVRGW